MKYIWAALQYHLLIEKNVKISQTWPFLPKKNTFRAIQWNPTFTDQILRKWSKVQKGINYDISTFKKLPLWRLNQIFLWYVVNVIPKEASWSFMLKKKKVTASFLRLALSTFKVYAAAKDAHNDGQVSIWKALLPHMAINLSEQRNDISKNIPLELWCLRWEMPI